MYGIVPADKDVDAAQPDARWANGEAITADDFMYSFKMLLDPKLVNGRGGAFAEDYIKILNAKAYYTQTEVEGAVPTWEDVGIKKVDDMTIEITTSIAQDATEVMSHLAYAWTVPVYEEMYESLMNSDRTATTYGTDIDKVVCSGAFTYNAWERDAEISFSGGETEILPPAGQPDAAAVVAPALPS